MERLSELQAKLERAEAEVERGVGHLVKERALMAHKVAGGQDMHIFCDLLAMLEDAQFLHVQHRDRIRREMDGAVAGKGQRSSL
ncbi:MAG TPA: hypothetical protein VGG79_02685 [Roseiarcus sp.]|jgi:hypothetical protein